MRTLASTSCLVLVCAWLAACSSNSTAGNIALPGGTGGPDGGNFSFGDGFGDVGSSLDTGSASDQTSSPDLGAPGDVATPSHQLRFVQAQDDFGGLCETICSLKVFQNGTRTLKVQYLVDGQPVPNATVVFAAKDPAQTLLTPGGGEIPTDDNGFAQLDVKSGSDVGTVNIDVAVKEDPQAPGLTFSVQVATKAKGPMEIRLQYEGFNNPADYALIQARLTKQEAPGQPACKDLDLGGVLPPATWSSPNNLQWNKPWVITFPQFQQSLPADGSPVTFTIVGIAAKGPGKPLLAAGCIDTGASVKVGPAGIEGESVTVVLHDIPPRLKGTYDLTMHFNLLSALPPKVETVLTLVLDIIKDPVGGILSLTCKLGGNPQKGQVLAELCKAVFKDAANPSIDTLSAPWGKLIASFLDQLLLSVVPKQVSDGLKAGKDVAEVLTNLEIGGVLDLQAEPDANGFLGKDKTEQQWNSVTYTWSLGQPCNPNDPACGKKTIDISAFQDKAIVGHFDLHRNAVKSMITIDPHALDVKWGALVNYLVEKQLLPLITGDPNVDSYGALLKLLMGGKGCLAKDTCCADFAAKLFGKGGSPFGTQMLTGMCNSLVDLGNVYVEGQLNALDATSGDPNSGKGLVLGAKDCPVFDTNGDNVIDMIGSPSKPCAWDMTLGLAAGQAPKPLKGNFTAKRQN